MTAKNQRSNVKLRFFTKDSVILLDSLVNKEILSVTTYKELSSSAHFFSITLSPRISKALNLSVGTSNITEIIKPYDLVEISFKVDDEDYKVEMIGFVSRASSKLSIGGNGSPDRDFEISGFGLAKALQTAKIFFNPYVNDGTFNGFGGLIFYAIEKQEKLLEKTNVSEFVNGFVRQFFTNTFSGPNSPYCTFTFGGREGYIPDPNEPMAKTQGIKLPDLIDFNSGMSTLFRENRINNPFILTEIAAGEEVNVWDVIKSYSDPPFHECFIDLRRDDFVETGGSIKYAAEETHTIRNKHAIPPLVFYLRTAPFSSDTWPKLTYHNFCSSDVINMDVATSEENIYNYYNVMAVHDSILMGIPQLAATAFSTVDATFKPPRNKVPIYDVESIRKYGLRQFPIQTTKYVDFISKEIKGFFKTVQPSDTVVIKACCTLARQLLRWFAFGEDFETGTIELKGRVGIGPNGASIGSRLIEYNPNGKETGKQFYIEGVSQQWSFGERLKTILTVTRGHFPYQYQNPQTGTLVAGRFDKVRQLCIDLHIDQKVNDSVFNPVEYPLDYINLRQEEAKVPSLPPRIKRKKFNTLTSAVSTTAPPVIGEPGYADTPTPTPTPPSLAPRAVPQPPLPKTRYIPTQTPTPPLRPPTPNPLP